MKASARPTWIALTALAFAASVAPAPRVLAADGSWNVNAAGNWSGTSSWLNGGVPGSTSSTTSTDIATFGFQLTGARTVTVDANRNIGGIIFSNPGNGSVGYTLSGGNLLLSNGGVIQSSTNQGNATNTISSAIAIQGDGGSATFTAGSPGLLSFTTGGITGVSTAGNTTTLTLNGNSTGANAITGVIGDGSAGGRLAVVKSGNGVWVLSGANTFSGGVTLNLGTLRAGNDSALGTGTLTFGGGGFSSDSTTARTLANSLAFTGDATIGNATQTGVLTFNGNADLGGATRTLTVLSTATFAGIVSNGSITKAGAGTLVLNNGANSFSSGLTLSAGTLQYGNVNALGADTLSVTNAATLRAGVSGTLANDISQSAGALTFDNGGFSQVLTGSVGGSAAAFNITGSGTTTFAGSYANTSGNNNSGSSTLIFAGPFSTAGSITGSAGGRIVFTTGASGTLGNLIAGAVSVSQDAGFVRYGGNSTFTGGFLLTGGTAVLAGNMGQLNTVTINGGALGGAGSTLSSTNSYILGGDFAFVGPSSLSLTGGTTTLRGTAGSSRTLDIQSSTLTLGNPVINDSGTSVGLTKTGTGTLVLSASNSFAGGVRLEQGTLQAGNNFALGTGTLTFAGGGLSGTNASTSRVLANNVAFTAAGGTIGDTTNTAALTFNGGVDLGGVSPTLTVLSTATFAGVVSNGSLTKAGGGTLVLSNANTYTGTTTVTSGTLSLSGGDNRLATTSGITITGGVLDLGNRGQTTSGGISFQGGPSSQGGTVQSGTLTSTGAAFDGQAGTVSAILAGSVGLTKAGNGTLTLSASNSYAGPTTINAGQLTASNTFALGSGTAALTLNGGVLSIGSAINISRSGPITLAGGTIASGTLTNTGSALTAQSGAISSVLAGAGGLVKTTSGTVTLSGANTFTGNTDINAGVLSIASSTALGSSGTIGFGGGTLQLQSGVATDFSPRFSTASGQPFSIDVAGGVPVTFATAFGTGGSLTKSGSGTLVLTASNGFTGGVNLAGGVLAVSGSSQLGPSGSVSFTGGSLGFLASGTVDYANRFSQAANQAYSFDAGSGITATITGNLASVGGSLTKTGLGTLVVSGSNTYTGPTTVSGGMLQFAQRASLYGGNTASWTQANIAVGPSDTIAVNVGGTGEFTAADVTALATNLGATGNAVTTGGLQAGSSIGFDTTNAAGGTFTVADQLADSTGSGGGSLGLAKLGTGRLVLSNSSSLSGGLVVNAGTLDLGGISRSFGPLSGSGGVITTSAAAGTTTLTTAVGSGTSVYSGSIQDNGSGLMALVKTGTGTLALAGASTHTGATTISQGALELRSGGSLAGPVAVGSDATLRFANGTLTAVTASSALSGSGSLAVTGGGAVQLTGNNASFTGATSITGGELAIRSAAALGSGASAISVVGVPSGLASVSSSTLYALYPFPLGGQLALVSGSGFTLARDLQLSGYGLRQVSTSAGTPFPAVRSTGNNVVSGSVQVSNAAIQSSFGTLGLSGPITTAVASGTLLLGGPGNILVSGPVSLSSGVLNIGGVGSYDPGAGTVRLTNASNSIGRILFGPGTGNTATTVRGGSGAPLAIEVSTAAALGGAVIDMQVPGTLVIRSGSAAAATFGTAGTLISYSPSSTNTAVSVVVDTARGGSDLNQSVPLRLEVPAGGDTGNRAVRVKGGHGYGVTLTGSGGGTIFVRNGSGGWNFQNASNGLLTINADVSTNLNPAASNWFGFNWAANTIGYDAIGDILFNGSFLATSATTSYNFQMSTPARVVMTGTQTNITGTNTLSNGTLAIRGLGALASGPINMGNAANPAALEFLGASTTGAGETWTRTINLSGTSGGAYLYANQAGTAPTALTINGPITASGTGAKTLVIGGSSTLDNTIAASIPNSAASTLTSLQKTGLGTWVLSATNGYTGSTTVSGGVLRLQAGAGDIVQNASAVVFDRDAFTNTAAGTLLYSGSNNATSTETVGALTPTAGAARIIASGSGATGSATLTFVSLGARTAGATVDFAPTTGGTIAFTTGPAGTNSILGGWATFGGTDWVNSGATASRFTGYTSLANSSNNAATNFSLDTASVALSGTASVNSLKVVGSSGTTALTLGGLLTNTTGGLVFDNTAGSAQITGSTLGAAGSEVIIHTGGSGGSSNVLTIGSLIGSGTTALTKSGSGTLVLTAANAYTGNTTINEGTVRLSGASATLGTISSTANVTTIRQGGTLDINAAGANATVTIGMLNGAGTVTNAGGGASTSGTLSIGSGTTTGGTGYFTGILQNGAGRLAVTKSGSVASVQYLTGQNTYTGPTTISSGTLAVTSLANIGQASGIGAGDATNADTNAASLVFNGGVLQYTGANGVVYQATQTPSVSIDRLFTLAGNGTIESSGRSGDNDLNNIGTTSLNAATLILSNTGAVRFAGAAGLRTLTLSGAVNSLDDRYNQFYDNQIALLLADNLATSNTLALTKTGNTLWKLTNTGNSYSGATTVSAGMLEVGDDSSSLTRTLSQNTNLNLAGANSSSVGLLVSTGTFARSVGTGAGEVRLTGNQLAGFAAGPADLVVNLGSGTLSWGSTNFNPGTLYLGGPTSLGTVTFTSPIDLNGATRTIAVGDNNNSTFDYAIVSGVISGSGGLTKSVGGIYDVANNAGLLQLTGANTYTGTTTISSGPLVVESIGNSASTASNLGAGSAVVEIASVGTLEYIGAGETTNRTIRNTASGQGVTIVNNGSGPLVLSNLTVSATSGATAVTLGGLYPGANAITSSLAPTATGTVNLTLAANSAWTLSGSNTFGTVTIGGGAVLGVGSDNALNPSAALAGFSNTFQMSQIAAVGGPRTVGNNISIAAAGSYFGFTGENSITYSGTLTLGSNDRTLFNNNIVGGTLSMTGPVQTTVSGTSYNLPLKGSGQTILSGSLIGSGSVRYFSQDAGASLTLAGNYAGNSIGGVWNDGSAPLIFASASAIPGTGAVIRTSVAGSTFAAGYAVDQAFLGRIATTGSSFAVGLAADSANNLDFSSAGANLTNASLGAVGSVTRVYAGTLTPNGTAYRLGGGGGTLDFQGTLTGASNTLTVGGDLAGLGGTVILSNTANSFGGATTVQRGTLQIASLTDSGSNSSVGTNASITLGSGTLPATLRYVGSGNTSNRTISTGSAGGIVDASGSGALDMSAGSISAAANTVVTLTGSSTANNTIGVISGAGASVNKTGPGLWWLTGNSTYTGRLTVLDGTLVVGPVGSSDSPFGSNTGTATLPRIGDSAVGASGTVALLAQSGSVSRGLYVNQSNGSQVVVLGGTGVGTTFFDSAIRLGRSVTLQASTGGTVEFGGEWRDLNEGSSPQVAFTVGSAGNAGTVRFSSDLPSSITGVTVVNGTAQLYGKDDRINLATPVTIDSALGTAALDIDLKITGYTEPPNPVPIFGPMTQSLANLTFTGVGSRVTGTGTLRLYNNGTSNASVTVTGTGTGHQISAAVALADNSTFNTGSASALTVSNVISSTGGAMGLTKTGLGTLTLSAANTFSGDTTVSAGTLLLGHSQALTASTFTGGAGSLSFGGLTAATFGGLAGSSNLALSNTTAGAVALTVGGNNQTTTYSGALSGAGGLTKSGTGVFTLAGTNTYSGATSIAAGRLAVDGSLASAVTVQAGATLGGSGRLAGSLTGDGLIAPGNSPGILTVDGQITPTALTSFAFEFSGTAPAWSNASASVNDVLRLTNVNPFTSGLGSGNTVNVYFDVASLDNGDTFLGGFFSDRTSGQLDFMAELGLPTYQFFVLGNGSGTATSYNGKSYYTLAQYNPALTGATVTAVTVPTANYASGDVTNGQVTQFVIIPEPGAMALAAIGIAAAAWGIHRRRM